MGHGKGPKEGKPMFLGEWALGFAGHGSGDQEYQNTKNFGLLYWVLVFVYRGLSKFFFGIRNNHYRAAAYSLG